MYGECYTPEMLRSQGSYIIELLEFATQHIYFWFNNCFYLQQKGVAMGAKFAPSLANLFMAKWEEHVIYDHVDLN